jgi:hypothetical protein
MTEFTGTQLATILSALDCRTRNPASKAVALAAIRRHADELGCTVEDVLAAAAGLLNGQVSAEDFRGGLRGQDANHERDDVVTEVSEQPAHAPAAATALVETETLGTPRQQLLAACKRAAQVLGEYENEPDILQMLRAAIARAERPTRRAITEVSVRPPRCDSKQARLVAMLQRGASISDMARELGWLRHTCHGALAGLKKKRGLNIISNKPADGERIYRLNAPAEVSGHVA